MQLLWFIAGEDDADEASSFANHINRITQTTCRFGLQINAGTKQPPDQLDTEKYLGGIPGVVKAAMDRQRQLNPVIAIWDYEPPDQWIKQERFDDEEVRFTNSALAELKDNLDIPVGFYGFPAQHASQPPKKRRHDSKRRMLKACEVTFPVIYDRRFDVSPADRLKRHTGWINDSQVRSARTCPLYRLSCDKKPVTADMVALAWWAATIEDCEYFGVWMNITKAYDREGVELYARCLQKLSESS